MKKGKALLPPYAFFPRRKDRVRENSIVEQTITLGRPVYRDRVLGLDLWKDREMAFLARPVLWYGQVAKVVLVGVLRKDAAVLEPQVRACDPWRLDDSFQMI